MKKKEVLIIFVLAALVTGGSWFAQRTKETYFETSRKWDTCTYRGFPMDYYGCWAISGAGYSNSTVDLFFLVLDFLLWFLVPFVLWQLTKYIKRKLGNKNKT